MMMCPYKESEFFLSHLKSEHSVLEYGSGQSSLEIASRVKKLVSVEHDNNWFKKMKGIMPSNVVYLYNSPNLPFNSLLEDGTKEQFENYIKSPSGYGTFDIIFIDGRARRDCAFFSRSLAHYNTLVFIHDFENPVIHKDRGSYIERLSIMDIIDHVESMYKFKYKNLNI